MVARLRRTERSRAEYPSAGVPDVFELTVDEERDLLVGRLSQGQVDFCEVLQLDCGALPRLLSERHSYIVLDEEGHHCVRDLETLNGTYVNGNLIPNKLLRLRNDDVLGFGGPDFVIHNRQNVVNPYAYVYENDDSKAPPRPDAKKRVSKVSFQSPTLSMISCEDSGVVCAACGKDIPRDFVCVKAEDMESVAEACYHGTLSCLKSFSATVRLIGIKSHLLGKEHEQAKRLISSLKGQFENSYMTSTAAGRNVLRIVAARAGRYQ